MILSPIRKVLSSITRHEVRALLMGGQACILYGAAEFSRDIDFAILASSLGAVDSPGSANVVFHTSEILHKNFIEL